MMNQPEQAVTQALDDLQVSTSLLQIVVVHLLAEFANGTVEPVDWVRGFAECVHASIDRADQPTDARSAISWTA
jgi:hypothetical protein